MCIYAINSFRESEEHGLTPIVVCSRTYDYEALFVRLRLNGAVVIQPLDEQQIDNYFQQTSKIASPTLEVIRRDTDLRELARSPFFLSMLTVTYSNRTMNELLEQDTLRERRNLLFHTYIETMFLHRIDREQKYSKDISIRYLRWLAQHMVSFSMPEYFVERTSPQWMTRKEKIIYNLLNVTIFGPCLGAVNGAIIGLIISQVDHNVNMWTFLGARIGLFIGLIWGIINVDTPSKKEISIVTSVTWSLKAVGRKLMSFTNYMESDYYSFPHSSRELFFGMIIWSIIIMSMCFCVPVMNDPRSTTMVFGIFVLVIIIMLPGLGVIILGIEEDYKLSLENSSSLIQSSVMHGLKVMIAIVAIASIGFYFSPNIGSITVLMGIILGIFVGLQFGIKGAFQHCLLWVILYWNGKVPWKPNTFFDYATSLIFLRQVGNGYIFIHRILMEYFAQMSSD